MWEKMSRCDCLKSRGEGKRSPPNSCRNYFYIQKRKNLVPFPLALWNCLRRIWNFQKYSQFFLLHFLRSRIFVLGRNYPLMYLYIFIAVMPKYLVTPQLSSTLNKAAFSPVNLLYYAVDVYIGNSRLYRNLFLILWEVWQRNESKTPCVEIVFIFHLIRKRT